MKEYKVSVQSLIDHIKTALDVDPWAKEMAEELLKEQPQIVRCKDCKYRMKNSCIIFQKYGGTKYDDWFCGDGVKKDA